MRTASKTVIVVARGTDNHEHGELQELAVWMFVEMPSGCRRKERAMTVVAG
jgi:hypothetical protein